MQELILLVLLVLSVFTLFLLRSLSRTLAELREKQAEIKDLARALRADVAKLAPKPQAAPPPKPAEARVMAEIAPAPAAAAPPRRAAPVPPPVPVPAALPPAPRPATPPPAQPPAPAPAWVESTREALRKMWNWIVVGEEFRRPGVSAEYAVASTWLLRVSIIAIGAGVASFLVLKKDQIPPVGRVAISIAVGLVMLIGGLRLIGRKYHVIGQGLLGGGLLVFYFSMYAASPSLYSLLPSVGAFALMALITVASGFLAVRTESLLIAILGLAGGYATPVLLRSNTPNLPALYAYLLLLSLGILGVARARQWRLLNYLAFVCTYTLFFFSLESYRKETDFVLTFSFLTAFFVVHSAIAYGHTVLRRRRATVLEILHLVANALVYAGWGYWLIRAAYGRRYPALLSLGLALFYTAQVVLFLRTQRVDRSLLTALLALAGAFTVWTLPLVLEKESLTIGFALLALTFLWLGRRIGSSFLQNLANGLYAFVFVRLLALDFPRNFEHPTGALVPAAEYWKHMLGRLWTFGITIASVVAAFLLQRRPPRAPEATPVAPSADTPRLLPDAVGASMFYWCAVGFVFLFLQLEFNAMFAYLEPLRLPALTVLWCLLGLYFLWRCLADAEHNWIFFSAAELAVAVAALKLLTFDLASWDICESLVYNQPYRWGAAGVRLLDYGVVLAGFLTLCGIGRRAGWSALTTPLFGYSALALLFAYASLETRSFLHWRLPSFQPTGLSILWSLFAIAFVVGGIARSVRALRYLGLALFVIVAVKVVAWDLADMEAVYRVVAFMVIGLILLIGSFAYIRSSRKFVREE